MEACEGCKKTGAPLCRGGYCADCHKGEATFEECDTGTDVARILLSMGHTLEFVRELFPEAKI